MRARSRLRRTAIWVAIQLFSSACDDADQQRRLPPRESVEESRALPKKVALGLLDAGAAVDPPAPVGDLAGEIQRFVDVSSCVAERGKMDPLVADALAAIGYDAFLVDACRLLDAAKKKDAAACRAITASPLRAQCERGVALLSASPDQCPLAIASSPSAGRDATCLAATTSDVLFCEGERGEAKLACLAFATSDIAPCARALTTRAVCERSALRWRGTFVPAKARNSVPAKAELAVRRESAGDITTNATSDVERGVVVVGGSAKRFSLGDLRDLGAVPHTSGMLAPRLGCVVVATKSEDARIETCELDVPGSVTVRGKLGVKLEPSKLGRADKLAGVIEGDLTSGTDRMHVRYAFSTFVRDVVVSNYESKR